MSNILADNNKGLMVSQRLGDIKLINSQKFNPFISRVTCREPLGLPPIRKHNHLTDRKYETNFVEKKNKDIIRKIQKLKKLERQIIQDDEKVEKIRSDRVRENALKTNLYLSEIRKELYGEEKNCNMNKTSKNTFFRQLNDDYHNLTNDKKRNYKKYLHNSVPDLNEFKMAEVNESEPIKNVDQEEMKEEQELLDFVNNLDYEKYMKKLEVREALHLLKNKVEKEKAEEEQNDVFNEEERNLEEEQNQENNENGEEYNQYDNNYHKENVIRHEKEWDSSVIYLVNLG
jgi:hypothetical protein